VANPAVDLPVLQALGWNADDQHQLEAWRNLQTPSDPDEADRNSCLARVIAVERTGLTVAPHLNAPDGHVPVSGRWFRGDEETRPTIGDWVVIDAQTGMLLDMLPRRSVIKRVNPLGALQLIAANVDAALIVTSCNADFSLERLERYLSVVLEANITPVLVLTKIDLAEDPSVFIEALSQRFPEIAQVAVDALSEGAVAALAPWCTQGQTIALLGSSGVGKSTLVNALSGAAVQQTAAIREEDGKGRHTTTNRSLHRLPQGGVILDSPGMRELQLAEAEEGIEELFADLEALAATCRFNDCSHASEPGCAVRAAIDSSELDEERLRHYQSLKAEESRNRETLAARHARHRAFGKKTRAAARAKQQSKDPDQ
jgi:ribosome biogenesis GTPase